MTDSARIVVTKVAPEISLQIANDVIAGQKRRVDKLEAALRAILDADHGGPAAALREALANAALLIGWQPAGLPRQRCVEDWETGPRGGIFHGPDSPIPDLVRGDPTIAAGDAA